MAHNRRLRMIASVAGAALALTIAGAQGASADPDNNNPGEYPAGKTPSHGDVQSGQSHVKELLKRAHTLAGG